MNYKNIHKIFFIGIGGIGMSALARFFHQQGKRVFGYDKTATRLTNQLIEEGIPIQFDTSLKKVEKESCDLVIYTPAVPKDISFFSYFEKQGIPIIKRAAVLGQLSEEYRVIAVAGTHGKTSVSSMSAFLFDQSKKGCNAILGGIAKNYHSNIILNMNSDFLITEADEFDQSFLQLKPEIAVITSADPDHLDIYGSKENMLISFELFTGKIKDHGTLLLKKGLPLNVATHQVYTYALDQEADFFGQHFMLDKGYYQFDFVHPTGTIKNIQPGVKGILNMENAIAALATGYLSGLSEEELRNGLSSFSGIKRRFETIVESEKIIFIDDYAHHPEEIRRTVSTLRLIYPSKKITGIFQPHLYSRTQDFATDFAQSLDALDQVLLLPIYPAREQPVPGITTQIIFDAMKNRKVQMVKKEDLIPLLDNEEIEILITLGAGDIDQVVEPIEKLIRQKIHSNG